MKMNRLSTNISLLLIISLLLVSSCNKTNRSGVNHSEVIPPEKMTELLTDLYLADGLLNYPPIRSDYSEKDSIESYLDVIESHGLTKEQADLSMRYYFIDKPDKYEDIYDRVIEKLSGREAELMQKMANSPDADRNLWKGESSYMMPDAGVDNPVAFSIQTEGLGEYIIKARITVYKDDQSINPHIAVWFWYDDGSEEGKKIMWERKKLKKNSRPEFITIREELDDPRVTHIQGRLLNHDPQSGHWEKHALVSNIRVNKLDDVLEREDINK
ncbi:MAG: DUF4296 domain-containing protein [Bacteroidales bacterium]|nr:DUF4296 domain-containing protein [Bacteroidales bacterium]